MGKKRKKKQVRSSNMSSHGDDMINFVWTSHISVGSARQHPVPRLAHVSLNMQNPFRRPPVMAEGPSSKTQVRNGHAPHALHGSMLLAAVDLIAWFHWAPRGRGSSARVFSCGNKASSSVRAFSVTQGAAWRVRGGGMGACRQSSGWLLNKN